MHCLITLRSGLSISTELELWWNSRDDWSVEQCNDEGGVEYDPTDAEVELAIEQAKDCF